MRFDLKRVFRRPAPGVALSGLMAGPLVVLDVGARGGPAQRFGELGDDVELFGLEPDREECARLERAARERGGRERYIARAAGREAGRVTIHRCRNAGCSSMYRPNLELIGEFSPELAQMFELTGSFEVEVEPLDRIAAEHGISADVLKLDVQGAELDVLAGAERVLEHVKLVETEVEFSPQYQGQPLFSDVDRHLRERNFVLLGLRRTFWRRRAPRGSFTSIAGGQLVHGDALYYNRAALARAADRAALARWLVALSAYYQHDFVEWLLQGEAASRLFSGAEQKALGRRLIPGLTPPWALMRRTLRRLHEPHHLTLRAWVVALRSAPALDWHDPDFY